MPVSEVEKMLIRRREVAEAADQRHSRMLSSVIRYESQDDLPHMVQEQMAGLERSSRKPKVCVLYYGGTLGMHWEERNGRRSLEPTNDARELLRPLEEWGMADRMQAVWFPVFEDAIDSTNARWPHWVSIGNAMKAVYDDFDGFVIAGGTDSLRFMTAAMHFQFPNLGKPAVAAAAQREASGWGSDAPENLAFALSAACSDLSGAHLALRGRIRDGRRIIKIQDRQYDAFTSPERDVMGHFEGEVVLYGNAPRRVSYVKGSNLIQNTDFRDGILSTEIQPFMSAESILHMAEDPMVQALLFITYGAGNVRNRGMYEGEMTHVEAISQLHKRGFPFVMGSPMPDGRIQSDYGSGVEAIEAGAISGGDTTGAALLIKVSRSLHNAWWTDERRVQEVTRVGRTPGSKAANEMGLYGLDYRTFRREMYRNHIGELNMDLQDVAP